MHIWIARFSLDHRTLQNSAYIYRYYAIADRRIDCNLQARGEETIREAATLKQCTVTLNILQIFTISITTHTALYSHNSILNKIVCMYQRIVYIKQITHIKLDATIVTKIPIIRNVSKFSQ